jgi:hypothetical protein
MGSSIEVADVFRKHGPVYRDSHGDEMSVRQLRAMRAIEVCRTAYLGGHVDECDHCGALRISYNSCRNRHCPKCQSLDKERWLESRKRELLPTRYFHVVFTLPEGIRSLALRNQRVIYNIFFRAVSETIQGLSNDKKHLGSTIGFIAVLHTWSQTLMHHPHLHCIVTGGGLSLDGMRWVSCKEDFFIHVKVLSKVFRGKFLDYLKNAYDKKELKFPGKIECLAEEHSFNAMLSELYNQDWVVYCKPPLESAEQAIEYLGRYTHRVAISNDRIVRLEGGSVTFRYRDSCDNDRIKYITLDAQEFIRRFLLHILPDNFVKIRHYGLLSNRGKRIKLSLCRELLGVLDGNGHEDSRKETWEDLLIRITGIDPRLCPVCGEGRMHMKERLPMGSCGLPP